MNKLTLIGQLIDLLDKCPAEVNYHDKFDYAKNTPFLEEVLDELEERHAAFSDWVCKRIMKHSVENNDE